jgi:hypothetical protein
MPRKEATPEEQKKIMIILQIPSDSTIQDRIIKVMQYTNLSYRGLLEKWLRQEESSLEVAKHTEEEILKRIKTRVDILEKQVLQLGERLSRPGKPSKAAYKKSLVFQVLCMRKADKTYKQIAEFFNKEGTHTLSGRGKWSPTSVKQLLYGKRK